ncbi:MAG TPA: serpin family protein [Bacteroidales bacterium]|nr:serpin family protein [Bacteroidales bacterium]
MKKIKLILTAGAIFLVILPACKCSKSTMENKTVAVVENTTPVNITENNNLFALDLYKKIGNNQANLFYSPYSISTALAMTYAGAKGKTENEMAMVMHFPANNAEFYTKYNDVLKNINALNNGSTVNIYTVNSIWAQKDFKFRDEFMGILKNSFNSSVNLVDFIKETENSRIQINKWVETQTNEKIKELIKPGLIDYLTRMVLVNAIYFKADWQTTFDKQQTQKMDFRMDETNAVSCDFMFAEQEFKFYENEDGLKAIEIPYSSGKMSMLIILPKDNAGFSTLKKEINPDFYKKVNSALVSKKVKLYLPKFKIISEFELSDMLKQMGMPEAFSDRADFSGMTGTKDLKISKVIHKAFVEVNETGTEAAAATAVVMRVKSMPVAPPEFRADHPFMFIIKENTDNSILFAGNIYNPTKE